MYSFLTRLAHSYLVDRGYIILPPGFIGCAFGNCVVTGTREEMAVYPANPNGVIIALNNSVVNLT